MLLDTYILTEIACPQLEIPKNTSIKYSDQSRIEGTNATYTCQKDYRVLEGNETRVCTTVNEGKAEWTGQPLVCTEAILEGKRL